MHSSRTADGSGRGIRPYDGPVVPTENLLKRTAALSATGGGLMIGLGGILLLTGSER